MTRFTKTTLTACLLFGGATALQAGNAGDSLPACVDHVVAACNEHSNHPQACTEAGLDACEELHGTSSQAAPIDQILIQQRPGGRYRVVLNGRPVPGALPELPGFEDEDPDGGRNGRGDPGGSGNPSGGGDPSGRGDPTGRGG